MTVLVLMFCVLATNSAMAQGVAINTTGHDPHASAAFDIQSTTGGLLIPRMTETDRGNISSPAEGLMVYQTDGTAGYYYFDGSAWKMVSPAGTQEGDMLYWDGTEWVIVDAGNDGHILYFIDGAPMWAPVIGPTDVMNPATGKVWMDRNLGATQVATSSTDADAYGYLYQWGRDTDGHQVRTSGTTTNLSSDDTPGHNNFIITSSSPNDWRDPQNDDLWQGTAGTNNPCPPGYRVPTLSEWDAERLSWTGGNNAAGAYASPLKFPAAGYRDSSNGSLGDVGSYGYYWSSTVVGTLSRYLDFDSASAGMYSYFRADGGSVRCLKDD